MANFLQPDRGWEIDLEHLESQIDEDTAAIVVNNPSNPCGSVFSEKHLEDIVEIASRNYLPIIADEIYEHLVGLQLYINKFILRRRFLQYIFQNTYS